MDPKDPIAIVGVGCRFPGANNLDEFWRLLVNGENHVKEIRPERWSLDHFYDPNPNTPNKSYVRRAGLIDNHDEWDNRFYGISASEAEQIDPQQRMVMDCVHMAMEDGGVTKKQLDGTYTGVYIGIMNDDYRGAVTGDGDHLDHYTLTGSSPSIASARVSYHYNLLGPAITIDTACSSALVAIHLATQAIRTGDCKMAICGGVNSILYPEIFIPLSKARMVSPTGQCQAFSAKADGYARGEGCGIVILKPLSMALADKDNIWATLVTGCNQDGHTATPITAPSSLMQGELLKRVYSQNNIDPADIQYIEAHGTGTPTGDPIEANALGQFFKKTDGSGSGEDNTKIGSVKTNIGHLESAAGSAGLIKVLLMMKHGQFVPSLHVEELNPAVDFEQHDLTLSQDVSEWREPVDKPRMACVNCFGFGGTNSHAVIKQYKPKQQEIKEEKRKEYVIALSAEDHSALKQNINHLISAYDNAEITLNSLSYTSTRRRDHYLYRTLVFANSKIDLQSQIENKLKTIEEIEPAFHKTPKIVYVFCGVGTTWQGMCQTLIERKTIFAETVKAIDNYLRPFTGWSIFEKLQNGDDVSDPLIGHLSIFTCQIALAVMWKHWGIIPDAIVGQSVGEVAGACVSGALTLKDAVQVIYYRSLILSGKVGGSMMVVKNCETSVLEEMCSQIEKGKVNIAVYSSPVSSTISGDTDAVNELKEALEKRNIELSIEDRSVVIPLKVKCAYHSHHMELAGTQVEKALQSLAPTSTGTPVYSTVYGELADEGFSSATYWGLNVQKPVMFFQALRKAKSENSPTVYLEIGPRPVMKAHMQDIFPESSNIRVLPSMNNKDEVGTAYGTFETLYGCGVDPVWENFVPVEDVPAKIPQYQFNKTKNLFESDDRKLKSEGTNAVSPLVTKKPGKDGSYKACLSTAQTPYVYDHFVQGSTIVPGALHGEIALELGREIFKCQSNSLKVAFQIKSLVALNDNQSCELDISTTEVDKTGSFKFVTRKNGNVCSKGVISSDGEPGTSKIDIHTLKLLCKKTVTAETLYGGLAQFGFEYGTLMRNVGNIFYDDTHCLAEINISDGIISALENNILHPAIIDAMWHSSLPLLSGLGEEGINALTNSDAQEAQEMMANLREQMAEGNADLDMLQNLPQRPQVPNQSGRRIFPVGPGHLIISLQPQKRMYCYTILTHEDDSAIFTNALLLAPDGAVIAEMKDIEHRFVDSNPDADAFIYEVGWKPMEDFKLSSNTDKTRPQEDIQLSSNTDDIKTLPMEDIQLSSNTDDIKMSRPMKAIQLSSSKDDSKSCNWLVVSFKLHFAEMISNVLPGYSHSIISSDNNLGPTNNAINDLQSFASDSSDSENLTGIVFAPGVSIEHGEMSPMEVTNFMRSSCLLLLRIVEMFDKSGIPIVVVTERTQKHGHCEYENVNVVGSELWGMVRSLNKESIETLITLIDLQQRTEISMSSLSEVILKVVDNELCNGVEISLSETEILTNEFLTVTEKGRPPTFRKNVFDDKCEIELRSEQVANFNNPFFTMQDTEVFKVSQKNTLVEVEEAVIQDPDEYPVTHPGSKGDFVVWPEDDERGHRVLSLEIKGKAVFPKLQKDNIGSEITTQELRSSKQKKYKKKHNVIACYPVNVASLVSIPSSCICRAKNLPFYSPGLLKDSVIAWNLIKPIQKRTKVCIVMSKIDSTLARLLQIMLESKVKRCTVEFIDESQIMMIEKSNPKSVILLSDNILLDLIEIMSNSTKTKYLVTMRKCLPQSQAREIKQKRKDMKITLLDIDDVFNHRQLMNSFPTVRKWLKKNKKALKSIQWKSSCKSIPLSKRVKTDKQKLLNVKVPKDMLFRPDCAYVIIGALTGLGWELLQVLAAMGAGTIITMSRRELSEENVEKLQNIEDIFGIKVVHLQADICNLLSLKKAFKEFLALNPGTTIKGIFNGAGVIDDALYHEMTEEKFDKAFLPKVLGTWNLHTISREFPLDYFVMHSSIASVLGNAGQCNYAAGNSFLDTMAHYRRSLGLAAQTINWGALTVGMAQDKALQQYLASLGFLTLDVDNIRSCFMNSLITNKAQVTYSDFDWATIGQILSKSGNKAIKDRLKTMLETKANKGGSVIRGQASPDAIDLEEFNKLSTEEKFAKLNEIVAKVLGEILTLESGIINPETDILELGLDSQRAMELISRLFSITYCRIPFVLVMSGESKVKDLVGYLLENIPTGSEDEKAKETVRENVKATLSYMEYYYYKRYMENPNDPSLSYVVDFQLSPTLSNPEVWKKVIQGVLTIHPELRTVHRPVIGTRTRFQVRKVILPPERAILDFRLVKKEDLALENGLPKNWSLCKFNPRTDLPIRILYVASGLQHTFRLVMNNVFTDISSLWILLGDIQRNLPSYMMHRRLTSSPYPAIDVTDMMEDVLLVELPFLEKFWVNQLGKCNKIITLSSDQKVHPYSFNRGVIKGEIPEEYLDRLKSYTTSKGITPFHVFASLYQLVLHKLSGETVVPVSSVVDMRMHFPEIATRIVNSRNYIPLIADFKDPDESFDEMMSRNSIVIKKSIFHGMYPFKMLTDKFENIEDILRHRIVLDDYSRAPKKQNGYKGFYFKMKNAIGGDYANETKLVLKDESTALKFELQYDKDSVNQDLATRMVDCLHYLLEHTIETPEKRSSEMFPGGKLAITSGAISSRKPASSKVSGTFMKQTKHGWSHEVKLTMQFYKENGCTYQRLAWKNNSKKNVTRLLPISLVKDVNATTINDIPSMIIQTQDRKYIFSSVEDGLVTAWVQNLKNLINSTNKQKDMTLSKTKTENGINKEKDSTINAITNENSKNEEQDMTVSIIKNEFTKL